MRRPFHRIARHANDLFIGLGFLRRHKRHARAIVQAGEPLRFVRLKDGVHIQKTQVDALRRQARVQRLQARRIVRANGPEGQLRLIAQRHMFGFRQNNQGHRQNYTGIARRAGSRALSNNHSGETVPLD